MGNKITIDPNELAQVFSKTLAQFQERQLQGDETAPTQGGPPLLEKEANVTDCDGNGTVTLTIEGLFWDEADEDGKRRFAVASYRSLLRAFGQKSAKKAGVLLRTCGGRPGRRVIWPSRN